MTDSRPHDSADLERASRRMLDRYELVAEIAKGGMGTVYLARLRSVGGFQRLFAIKLLHPHLAEQPHFVSMLLDEARLAARLHHPNAVGIIDVCDSDLGYYLVMQYVDGFTLEELLEGAEAESAELRVRLGLRILLDTGVGLSAAHKLKAEDGSLIGLVHRDVSPQNILVGTDGVGRITDFGVARAAARITSSQPGMIKGKPCYMAPEQAQGGPLDARADVFAMGIILWETLTGKRCFQSEAGAAGVLYNVIHEELRRPSEVNEAITEALDVVCMKALERDLDARYQSCRELVEALEEAAKDAGMLASTHQVSDAVQSLFVEDLERREEAIRLHIEALEQRPSIAAHASDIYRVPRLQSSPGEDLDRPTVPSRPQPSSGSGPWHEGSGEGEASVVSGSVEAASGASGTFESPAGDPAVAARQRTLRLAVGLTLMGLAMLGLAIFLVVRRAERGPRATMAQPPSGVVSPASPSEVEPPAPTIAPPPSDPAPETAETAPTASGAEAAPEGAPMEGPEVATPATTMRPSSSSTRIRAPRRPAPRPTSMEPSPTTDPQQPVFEDNPYIRR